MLLDISVQQELHQKLYMVHVSHPLHIYYIFSLIYLSSATTDMTLKLEHKSSRVNFFQIEIYTSFWSWINKLSIDVWFVKTIFGWDRTILKSGIWRCKKKFDFKVVQMKFLAMHVTNKKRRFDIFTIENVQNIIMEHDLFTIMICGIKFKSIILIHTMSYCYK